MADPDPDLNADPDLVPDPRVLMTKIFKLIPRTPKLQEKPQPSKKNIQHFVT
jgi:hypothetical protein